MQKGVLFGLIVITTFFLMGQGCYFNQLSTSGDALECEYTGQLFCADDGLTRVCSFINGQPHLENDGQECDPETGALLIGESTNLVVDFCDTLAGGTYCDGNDLIKCVDEDEDTTSVTICPDICVDNNDGNAECDTQQENPTLVAALNLFCDTLAEGLYCYGSPNDVLVACASGEANIYMQCISVDACSTAQGANDFRAALETCDPNYVAPLQEDACDTLADGTYCQSNTVITCFQYDVTEEGDCLSPEVCSEDVTGAAQCEAPSTTGNYADFCDEKENGIYCQDDVTLIYCAGYDGGNTGTCDICSELITGQVQCDVSSMDDTCNKVGYASAVAAHRQSLKVAVIHMQDLVASLESDGYDATNELDVIASDLWDIYLSLDIVRQDILAMNVAAVFLEANTLPTELQAFELDLQDFRDQLYDDYLDSRGDVLDDIINDEFTPFISGLQTTFTDYLAECTPGNFCYNKANGSYCQGDATLILCDGGDIDTSEPCNVGCDASTPGNAFCEFDG